VQFSFQLFVFRFNIGAFMGLLREHPHFIIAQCFVCLSFVSWFSDTDSGRQATEKTHFLHLPVECLANITAVPTPLPRPHNNMPNAPYTTH
jgi:hypothetical protein